MLTEYFVKHTAFLTEIIIIPQQKEVKMIRRRYSTTGAGTAQLLVYQSQMQD